MIADVGQAIAAYAQTAKSAAKGEGGGEDTNFASLLAGAVKSAAGTMANGEAMSLKAIANQADLNEVVQAVTQAEVALQTVVAVRDRVIQAYNDIIKMPI